MAENKNSCTGNCMACVPFQRQYCAAQITFSNMKMLNALSEQMEFLSESVGELSDKIEAIQNNDATVFNPIDGEEDETILQEGDGKSE